MDAYSVLKSWNNEDPIDGHKFQGLVADFKQRILQKEEYADPSTIEL